MPAGPDGKRRRKTVSSKDYGKALEKFRALSRSVDDGIIPSSSQETVERWLEKWLDFVDVKPTVKVTYGSAVRNQINPHIGSIKMSKLLPADVREMARKIVEVDGKSTGTALQAFRVLSKSLTDARREGVLRENVCERVKPPQAIRESRGSHERRDVQKLFEHLVATSDPLTSRWAMALMTGARQAECLGLEWDRVDFANDLIDISWTLQWLRLKNRYQRQPFDHYRREDFDVKPDFDFRPIWKTACLIPPKTRTSRRVVPMIAPLKASLLDHWESLGRPNSGLVWMRLGNRPIRKSDDAKAWHELLVAAGVPDLTLHSARHTVATLLQSDGVPEATRMALMGYSSVAAHRGYAHVDQSLTRSALGGLSQRMGGNQYTS